MLRSKTGMPISLNWMEALVLLNPLRVNLKLHLKELIRTLKVQENMKTSKEVAPLVGDISGREFSSLTLRVNTSLKSEEQPWRDARPITHFASLFLKRP